MSGKVLIHDIQRAVAIHYGSSVKEMLSDDREWKMARPRQVAMFLARELSSQSTTVIGHWFNRHHTTVIFAERAVRARMEKSQTLRREIDRLKKRLSA